MIEEIIKRWLSETPSLFRLIRNIGLVVAFVIGIPALVNSFQIQLCEMSEFVCFDLPAWWDGFWSKVIPIMGSVAAFVSQLTATTGDKAAKDIPD
jgi:hypothetical protein